MRIIKPINLKDKSKIKNKFFVFDVETTKLEPQPKNFVFGVIYGYNFTKVIKTIKDFKKEFKKHKYENCYFFAHNAEFDLSTIFGNIITKIDSKAVFNGKFICCNYNQRTSEIFNKKTNTFEITKKGGITFADSLNIYPAKLEDIGKLIDLPKLENRKVINNTLQKNNINQEDIKYCIRDCEIIYNALLEIFENVGAIKLTIASLSMYKFRSIFLKNSIIYSELTDQFYDSYYGGRNEVFKIGETISNVYDINSLYPYSMLGNFPNVKNLKKESRIDLKYFFFALQRYEGLANVEIEHLDNYFGYLPYKYQTPTNKTKLIFPIGNFEGIYNFNELRFAIKSGLIKIKKVNYIIYSNSEASIFKDFVNTIFNQRKEASSKLEKTILKLILNSNYGKWAQRIKFEKEYFQDIPFELIEELKQTEKFVELQLFNINRNDCFVISKKDKFKNSFFAVPTYSSYTTSYARIELLKNLIANQNNGVVYCDTDSIFLEKSFLGSIGNNLGQFKQEKKLITHIKGLKHYTYFDLDLKLDKEFPVYFLGNYLKEKETLKGVSKNSIRISKNQYKKLEYYKTLESLQNGKETGSKKVVIKTISGKYDKRIILPNGQTKPIKL